MVFLTSHGTEWANMKRNVFLDEYSNAESKGLRQMMMIPGVMVNFFGIAITELTMIGTFTMYSVWMVETVSILPGSSVLKFPALPLS